MRYISSGPKKLDHFQQFVTRVSDDIERRFIYWNVQYIIWSMIIVLNFITIKYSLH